jgi:hypothetical protein
MTNNLLLEALRRIDQGHGNRQIHAFTNLTALPLAIYIEIERLSGFKFVNKESQKKAKARIVSRKAYRDQITNIVIFFIAYYS